MQRDEPVIDSFFEYWFRAVVSYLLFGDEPAGDAAVLATLTAVGTDRETMVAVLLAMAAKTPDTVMLLFVRSDATKDPAVWQQPLPNIAAAIKARAHILYDRVLSSHDNFIALTLMRNRLRKKSSEYELALGGMTEINPAVFSRLDPEGMSNLIRFYSLVL